MSTRTKRAPVNRWAGSDQITSDALKASLSVLNTACVEEFASWKITASMKPSSAQETQSKNLNEFGTDATEQSSTLL